MIRRSMRRLSPGRDLHLKPAFMTTVNKHLRRLTDDDEIRFDLWIDFNKCIGGNPVTPLFHVAKVIRGPSLQQTQIARHGKAIDHPGRGTFLIAGTSGKKNPIFDLAFEWIPFPFALISNTNSINM